MQKTDVIKIVVSILPFAEFVEKIGGDRVAVTVMVPPGASPHTYELTPSQLRDVSEAKMYVKVGTPIQFELVWLDKILSVNKDMLVVDASSGIDLMRMGNTQSFEELDQKNRSERYDPHIWLSPQNAKIIIENIYNSIVSIDSSARKYYTANKEKYLQELGNLDQYVKQILSAKRNKRFMVYHPAWGYFARYYNLEQIPVEAEGKEPTAKSIQHLIEQAKNNRIKVVFASPQFNPQSAEVIVREIRGRLVLIDPLEKDYVSNMRKLAKLLSTAMD